MRVTWERASLSGIICWALCLMFCSASCPRPTSLCTVWWGTSSGDSHCSITLHYTFTHYIRRIAGLYLGRGCSLQCGQQRPRSGARPSAARRGSLGSSVKVNTVIHDGLELCPPYIGNIQVTGLSSAVALSPVRCEERGSEVVENRAGRIREV